MTTSKHETVSSRDSKAGFRGLLLHEFDIVETTDYSRNPLIKDRQNHISNLDDRVLADILPCKPVRCGLLAADYRLTTNVSPRTITASKLQVRPCIWSATAGLIREITSHVLGALGLTNPLVVVNLFRVIRRDIQCRAEL